MVRPPSQARVGFHPSPKAHAKPNPLRFSAMGDDDGRQNHVNRAVGEQVRAVPEQWTSCWRRGSESNRRMGLLQSPALPLGYPASTQRTAIVRAELGRCKGVFSEVGSPPGRLTTSIRAHDRLPAIASTRRRAGSRGDRSRRIERRSLRLGSRRPHIAVPRRTWSTALVSPPGRLTRWGGAHDRLPAMASARRRAESRGDRNRNRRPGRGCRRLVRRRPHHAVPHRTPSMAVGSPPDPRYEAIEVGSHSPARARFAELPRSRRRPSPPLRGRTGTRWRPSGGRQSRCGARNPRKLSGKSGVAIDGPRDRNLVCDQTSAGARGPMPSLPVQPCRVRRPRITRFTVHL